MKTKLFTLCALLLIAVNAVAQLNYDFTMDGIYYNITSSKAPYTAEVTSNGLQYPGDISIPASVTYENTTYSVTSIGDYAFDNCTGLTGITIPNSVTSIGYRAFNYCTGLTSITIPNSVTSIGYQAFRNCTGLTSITIPNSVTSIGMDAFYNTAWYDKQPDGLIYINNVAYAYKGEMPENTSITLKAGTVSITDLAFYNCTGLTGITIPNSVTSIGMYAFYGCTGLTSITIPNSVTSIGYWAFHGTAWYDKQPDGLIYINNVAYAYKGEMPENTSITLKAGTVSITESAFEGCTGLTSITIPNSVTSIGYATFNGCTGLTSITIPNSVTSIGYATFNGCTGLTSITIPNSVTSIGNGAFGECTGLTSITIPNSVTSIGGATFEGCTGLTSITIPNSVTSIGYATFYGCTGLTSIIIPNSVTSIGYQAFEGCTGLTSITIPNSVTSIGEFAFAGCTGLTSITIPNSVTSIEWAAFSRCTGLTSVTCLATTPPDLDEYGFDNYEACDLYVPEASLADYKAHAVWSKFRSIQKIDNTAVEDVAIPTMQIIGSTVLCDEAFRIYNLSGQDLTAQNGSLPAGVYIVRTATAAQKVRVE